MTFQSAFPGRFTKLGLPAAWLLGVWLALGCRAVARGDVDVARSPPPAAQADPARPAQVKRIGRVITVNLPINNEVAGAIKQTVESTVAGLAAAGNRPVLIFEFRVPPNNQDLAGQSEFAPSLDLALLIASDKLNGVTSVAYVPQPISGHADLVVMACQQIVMGPDAELGPAGLRDDITPTIRSGYKEIAERHKKIPAEVALGLLDSHQQVLVVETDMGTEYVTPAGLAELKKNRTIQSKEVLFDGAQPAHLTADVARKQQFIDFKAESLRDLASQLDLAPESVKKALVQNWRAVRVDLVGRLTGESTDRAQQMIKDAVRNRRATFICLWIDSAGGSPADAITLANFLADARALDPSRIRTVAYVPTQARADAALVALACDEVIVGPRAIFGGDGEHAFTEREIDTARRVIEQTISTAKSRSWSLPAAIVDPNLAVYRCSRPGEVRFFSDEELKKQPADAKWVKGERVTQPGRVFETIGDQAKEFLLADDVVQNFGEFKQRYQLERDPTLLAPGWADELVQALASPWLSVLLLMVGFAAIWAELHAPGLGVAGFVAAVCFALFFWSRFLGGTAGWLEVTLFAAGIACVLLEVFVVPGVGIFGLGGGLMVIISLILASQTFVIPHNEYQFAEFQRSLFVLGGAIAGTIALAMVINRWLPKTPVLGRMVLEPPAAEEAARVSRNESLVHFEDLLGARGTTTTQLTPSGKALFGDRLVDVITEGDLIERGKPVVVAEVEGYRVLVRPADDVG